MEANPRGAEELRKLCIESVEKEPELCEKTKKKKKKKEMKVDLTSKALPPLPRDVCLEVAKHVHDSEALAFAMTSRDLRDAMKEALEERVKETFTTTRKLMKTSLRHFLESDVPVS